VLVRTLLTLVNFAIFAATIGAVLLYPQYDAVAFYFLLGWMVASFALFYLPIANRRVGGAPAAPAAQGPLPSTGAPTAAAPTAAAALPRASALGFCVYCAAPLPVGADRCRECGHALPNF
jgi:ribosomal protein L40E